MRHTPSRRSVLAAGAVVATAAGCSSGAATTASRSPAAGKTSLEKSALTVATVPAVTNLGLFLAQTHGFFKAEGLTVTITPVTSSTTAITGQLHGSVDVTAGAYVSYISSEAKSDGAIGWHVLAEGSLSRPRSQEILVASHSSARTLKDLTGKTIGVNLTGNIGSLLIDSALASQHVGATAVRQVSVPFPDMAASLANGAIAAGWFDEPFRSEAIRKIGARPLFDTDNGVTQNFPISGYMVTKNWASTYPNTAAAFARALVKGQQLAGVSPSADTSALSAFIKGVTPAVAGEIVLDSYPLTVSETRIQRVATVMHQFGLLTKPFDVSPMIG
jgi:NitT/TauT family transport system substrate-binding protein